VTALVALAALSACGDPEAERAAEVQVARQEMAAAETTARQVAAQPSDGRWTEAHLMDRLLRAGVAPRANPGPAPEAPWFGVAPLRILAGGGEVYAWIYPDSAARKAATDGLDSLSAAPPGRTTPFAPPMRFVTNNNLALVITGGRITNHDRIALAIQAGLPVTR
jgi:hypothetical protein